MNLERGTGRGGPSEGAPRPLFCRSPSPGVGGEGGKTAARGGNKSAGGWGPSRPLLGLAAHFSRLPQTLIPPKTRRPAAPGSRRRRDAGGGPPAHPISRRGGCLGTRGRSFRCHPRSFSPPSSGAARLGAGVALPGAAHPPAATTRPPSLHPPAVPPAPGKAEGTSGSLFHQRFVFKSSQRTSPELYTLAAARPRRGFLGKGSENHSDFAKTRGGIFPPTPLFFFNLNFIFFPPSCPLFRLSHAQTRPSRSPGRI